MTRLALVALVVAGALLSAAASTGAADRVTAQQTTRDTPVSVVPAGHATVAGTVEVDGSGGPQPLRHAIVTLSGPEIHGSMQLLSDDAGQFAFAALPAGRYTLTAEKAGFVKTFYGSRLAGRGPARPIAVADGQAVTDVRLTVLRGAVIAGTIYDEQRHPIPSAQVQLQFVLTINGERKATRLPAGPSFVTTDERGRYRIFGLVAGDYHVYVGGGGGAIATSPADIDAAEAAIQGASDTPAARAATRAADAAPTLSREIGYYPGVTDAADAEIITLAASEERDGVDVTARLIRVAAIDGTAVDPGGQPLESVQVGVVNVSTGSTWMSPGSVRPDATGHFRLAGLPPATYRFVGRAVLPAEAGATGTLRTLWTSTDVVVDQQDVSGVIVAFAPGSNVAGRLVFQGSQAPSDLTKIHLRATAVDPIDGSAVPVAPTTPHADGTFVIESLAPGKYRFAVDGADGWTLRSAIVGGRDVLDDGFDVKPGEDVSDLAVTMTDRPTVISGTLVDQLDRPAPDYSVVLFPTNRDWWTAPRRLSGIVKIGSDGRFRVVGLPPGEYYLCAITDLDATELRDPSVLEQLAAAAVRITLGEGEARQQDLKIGG